MIPVEQVNAFEAEMKNASADLQAIIYGGAKHKLMNPNSDSIGMPGIRLQQNRGCAIMEGHDRLLRGDIRGLAASFLPGTRLYSGHGLIDRSVRFQVTNAKATHQGHRKWQPA